MLCLSRHGQGLLPVRAYMMYDFYRHRAILPLLWRGWVNYLYPCYVPVDVVCHPLIESLILQLRPTQHGTNPELDDSIASEPFK